MTSIPSFPAVSAPLEAQLAQFGQDLSAFLERLPGYVRGGRLDEAHSQCLKLVERIPATDQDPRWARAWAAVVEALSELKRALESRAKAYVLARYEEAARAYEHWLASWRAARAAAGKPEPALRSLRPLKAARTWFHISMGVLGTALYEFVLTRGQATAVLVVLFSVFGGLEVSRRLSKRWNHFLVTHVFHQIARPGEYYKINSATWYLLALCLLVPLAPKPAVIAAVLILALADPAAAWAGKAWGKRKLYRNKSWVGTAAFALTAMVVAGGYLIGLRPEIPVGYSLLAAASAAVLGAMAELFSGRRIDDNLAVPMAAVLAATPFVLLGA